MKLITRIFTLTICLLLAAQISAQDKPAPSPLGKVYQKVGLTDIEIEYSRPGVKGRTIFGADGLVPYGKLWRTGANGATKITFSTDVKVNGQDVKAGTYSILSEPGATSWKVFLNSNAAMRGTGSYDAAKNVASIEVDAQEFPFAVETMTFVFGDVSDTSCAINMVWEKASIVLEVEVPKTW